MQIIMAYCIHHDQENTFYSQKEWKKLAKISLEHENGLSSSFTAGFFHQITTTRGWQRNKFQPNRLTTIDIVCGCGSQ